ncbi:unnamed protein product, partial [Polarella glacialis]
MKGVNNESSNTDKMRAHQMKAKSSGDALRHEDVDLMVCTDLIDQSRTAVLNGLSSQATLLEVLAPNPEDKVLVSDVDPQLLMKIVFKERVNLTSVSLRFSKPPAEEEDQTYAKPRLIKIFCNSEDLDFGDVEEMPAFAQWVSDKPDEVE